MKKILLNMGIIGIISIISMIFIGVIVIPLAYYSSFREAKIFNERSQSNYTAWDFFWAKDQINQQVQTLKIEGIK